jgi:hypothetical protein
MFPPRTRQADCCAGGCIRTVRTECTDGFSSMTKPWTWHRHGGWSAGKKLSSRDINHPGLGSLPVMPDGEEIIEGAGRPGGMGPQGIAVDAAGRRAFVACSRGNAIAVVPPDGPAVPWWPGTRGQDHDRPAGG